LPKFSVLNKNSLDHWAHQWLLEKGLSPNWVDTFSLAIDISLLVLLALLLDFLARRVILALVTRFIKRSKNEYDDIFLEKRVFSSLAHLLPALFIYYTIPVVFSNPEGGWVFVIQKVMVVYIILSVTRVATKFLKAVEHIGLHAKRFEGKPISSYVQVFLIVVYITAGIFIISNLVEKSAITILTTFGAATAVILLIFRDTILGLVASIQIAGNDMVRLGDWVSMEKYGADGDVIEINLTTVKVRNFDKTITTVPTYAFISDSFKNWRGMQSQGIRRIKRSLHVDLNSVKFADESFRERCLNFERVSEYVGKRQQEIDTYNAERKVNKGELLNGRHMTNLGIFRNYALNYLKEHPKVAQNETVMVRQLQSGPNGLPLEVYCFSNDIVWANYEGIQSDIFEHLYATLNRFDLEIYQSPSGRDFRKITPAAGQ
jgi:miniconductance mechanosensitive channel